MVSAEARVFFVPETRQRTLEFIERAPRRSDSINLRSAVREERGRERQRATA